MSLSRDSSLGEFRGGLTPSDGGLEARPATRTPAPAPPASDQGKTGLYIYCVAGAADEAALGDIGIQGNTVYSLAHQGLCAVVHDCPAQPYQSSDAGVAAAWVLAHHRVVEAAWQRWGTVLPMTFNTIVTATEGRASDSLKAWLETEHECLRSRLQALGGKAEYGIQVFWDAALAARRAAQASPAIAKLEAEAASRSRGQAYMLRQRLEGLLRKEIENLAAQEAQGLYEGLRRCAESVRVEKARRDQDGRQMLLNLSCLVAMERYPELEAAVDRINGREGCSVRLAGPFPPYSFCQ